MKIQNDIKRHLEEAFSPQYLDLENESYMHNVPEGSESHFKLVLVSDQFAGKRLVQRHQLVYGALAKQMTLIHALAMHLFTPEEWSKRQVDVSASPNCHGGGRG
ncbi:transcriptional regulator BolA [Marinomonas spartinae]|uniref:DNA-binding transcriptional regulator BolA n=1 Tax=Marinomonas spartinae TaxID=1792290 RepID=A0A1A8TJI2_9GAMM|nr:BolA/IbaG family iron-sulfur metabolism protein [Marinomonas spartinae]SBS33941.1 transcriptional regulator BolA [Marinomonas spartinae]SBS37959.1 transcriptional regulator BolA [Marinomonas spartinae]